MGDLGRRLLGAVGMQLLEVGIEGGFAEAEVVALGALDAGKPGAFFGGWVFGGEGEAGGRGSAVVRFRV